ncbi:Vacuolar protein sorting-associated protein 62 [Tulasnella sp. 403]|nr:Vacuolar protein sorting-associated protein 62 [Tulasnella sp. 403]
MSEPGKEVKQAADSIFASVAAATQSVEGPSDVPKPAQSSPAPDAPHPSTNPLDAVAATSTPPATTIPIPDPTSVQVAADQVKDKPTSAFPPLPAYALQYAPLLWLHPKERYWPGNPLEHLENCIPKTKDGKRVDVPADVFGKADMLKLPQVNTPDIYLTLNKEDPRVNDRIEKLTSTQGKPHPDTRRSDAACWIITADKKAIVGEGIVDVFYFYFYPYNLGNTVVFTEFGNHVGDWEHSMVRFQNGTPIAMHLSAHSDGHAWAWKTMEKMGERPVGYVASGSHAMYGKKGDHAYSPAGLLGPIDHTGCGILWDPILNYCAASYDCATSTFSPLSAASATSTSTAMPPAPGAAPAVDTPGQDSSGPSPPNVPAYDVNITPEQIVVVLTYQGHWGDYFTDIRAPKESIGDKLAGLFNLPKKGEKRKSPTLEQKIEMLKWAEGPTGPRYKSLERVGMQWNTTKLLDKLV